MSIELQDLDTPFLNEPGSKLPAVVSEQPLDFQRLAQIPVSHSYKVIFEDTEISVDPLDWRHSTLLKLQVLAGFWNFILFGLADQAVGTVIPILEEYYSISDSHTGLIFLASTAGYFVVATVTEICHRKLGVRGVGIFGGFSMALSYLIVYQKPPYLIFVAAYFLSGLGFGSLDACLNGWMGNLVDLNQLLGILHGCYGIGCMILPPLVTRLLHKATNPWLWNDYYLVLSCFATTSMVFFAVVFRHETPAKYKFMVMINEARKMRQDKLDDDSDDASENSASLESVVSVPEQNPDFSADPVPLSVALGSKLVWSFAIIMFIYVGAESAFGTWLVTFLTRIKHLSYEKASYLATAFWTGLTLGRIFLGFVTAHYFLNELNANWCYMALSLLGHVLFCLVVLTPFTWLLFPIVLFLGLFVGPIFPTNIVSAIRILPAKFHTSGVGFICAFGGGGAAAIPFLVGLVAETSDLGLRFYPYIIAFFYLVLLVLWTIVRTRNLSKLKLTT